MLKETLLIEIRQIFELELLVLRAAYAGHEYLNRESQACTCSIWHDGAQSNWHQVLKVQARVRGPRLRDEDRFLPLGQWLATTSWTGERQFCILHPESTLTHVGQPSNGRQSSIAPIVPNVCTLDCRPPYGDERACCAPATLPPCRTRTRARIYVILSHDRDSAHSAYKATAIAAT